MILGVGLDIVDVEAFAAQLADRASGFVEATFRHSEQRVGRTGSGGLPLPAMSTGPQDGNGAWDPTTVGLRRAQHLAGRFAAKEALIKAWATARRGRPPALAEVDLRQIEVVDDGYGRPALRLHGAVAAAVADLTPGSAPFAHLSISHDGHVAAAVVVLEAVS